MYVITCDRGRWWDYCVYFTTHLDIPIRRRGIQIVSFYFQLVAKSARYWSAHNTHGKPGSLMCLVYITYKRDHSSMKHQHISPFSKFSLVYPQFCLHGHFCERQIYFQRHESVLGKNPVPVSLP